MIGDPLDTTIEIGEDNQLVIRNKRNSEPVLAKALGIDYDSKGVAIKIYVDRLIHEQGADRLGCWDASGAISTILERANT